MALIYTNKDNLNTLKIILCGLFAKKKIQLKFIEFTEISSPVKRLPIIELENGVQLFSSNAASKYLFPSDNFDDIINQLLEWESTVFLPTVLNNFTASNLQDCLKFLDNYFTKQFIVDDKITVADLVLFSSIYGIYSNKNVQCVLSDKLNVWIRNMLTNSNVQTALNDYSISAGTYKVLMMSIPTYAISTTKIETQQCSVNSSPSHQISYDVLTADELHLAKTNWISNDNLKVKAKVYPVVPVQGERNILITSALPYVNNVPHLGNIIGCVLSADVFARYCRLCNYNTLYISGTDEYGTATETKALSEGLTPQQICDKYFQIHNDIYRWFGIGFDYFGRTTTPEQTEICQEYFLKLYANRFISTQSVEQLFCGKCERFLADRFVEGGCPHIGCNYEDARGDQCDGCGKLVNAIDLKNPRCKLCSSTPSVQSSEQFFFDLPKIEPMLKLWMQSVHDGWSHNAKVIGNTWLKEGLKPRCITRDLKWGVPVPLEKYKRKVFYVWFDAPFGYMSISKRYSSTAWKDWWCPKKDNKLEVELYQFMAKDNVPFHSVMFPAALLAINEGHTTVKHLMATEYLNYEDGKFSKSRGVGVFGNDARDTGIPADVWRFYLLFIRPESQDSSFSWIDLATKNNSELLNNLGNFVNRALVFCDKFFNSTIPEMILNDEDITVLALCNRELKSYINSLEKAHLKDGIRHILAISRHGNQYMQANQPWVLVKGSDADKTRAGTVIGISCNIACLLMTLLSPYMPETSRIMKQQLNVSDEIITISPLQPFVRIMIQSGHKIGKPAPLFSKIESSQIEELRAKYGGVQNENGSKNTRILTCDFEIIIKKQEDKINSLKCKGASADVLNVENNKLQELKKQLKDSKQEKSLVNGKNESVQNGSVDENLIKHIEAEILEQGTKIRLLKSSGADKSVWQPEVNKLLELKAKLIAAGGTPPQPPPSASGKSKKK